MFATYPYTNVPAMAIQLRMQNLSISKTPNGPQRPRSWTSNPTLRRQAGSCGQLPPRTLLASTPSCELCAPSRSFYLRSNAIRPCTRTQPRVGVHTNDMHKHTHPGHYSSRPKTVHRGWAASGPTQTLVEHQVPRVLCSHLSPLRRLTSFTSPRSAHAALHRSLHAHARALGPPYAAPPQQPPSFLPTTCPHQAPHQPLAPTRGRQGAPRRRPLLEPAALYP